MITTLCASAFVTAFLLPFSGTTPIQVVASEGDSVGGVGLVTTIAEASVNDAGDVLAEVDTDNANTDIDGAVLFNGALLYQEGQALPLPLGATLDSFDSITGGLNGAGDVAWNLFLDGTAGTSDDSGIYLNDVLVFQEGAAPAVPGLTAGTPFIGFFDVKHNDAGQLLVMASVDDPAIASTVDRALVLFAIDGTGAITGATLVAAEGQIPPGQTEAIADMETNAHNTALNAAGQAMYIVDLAGDTLVDLAVYIDGTLVAQEGSPSPVAGRAWQSLSGAEIDLDDAGGWVISGDLDGDAADDAVIVTSAGVLAQEGGTLPAIAPSTFSGFGTTGSSGPVYIGNNGNVLWSAEWDGGASKGLFLNDRLLLELGVTMVGGLAVEEFFAVTEGYTLSPDGSKVVVRARLVGSVDVLLLIDVGPWVSLGKALAGALGAPCLVGSGTLAAGDPITLELTGSVPLGSTSLVIGLAELCAPFKGGTLAPTIDLILAGLPLDAGGDLTLSGTTPAGLPSGTELVFQFWAPDGGGPKGFNASNGVKGITP